MSVSLWIVGISIFLILIFFTDLFESISYRIKNGVPTQDKTIQDLKNRVTELETEQNKILEYIILGNTKVTEDTNTTSPETNKINLTKRIKQKNL